MEACRSSKAADWMAVLTRMHGVGLCAECEKTSNSKGLEFKCSEHRPLKECGYGGHELPLRTNAWWQRAVSDPGQELLDGKGMKKDERSRAAAESNSAWRLEWGSLRAEQLALQGESQGATGERLTPGRPESVEWLQVEFNSQISTLSREHGFTQEYAIAYTLLTCGGLCALARAARSAGCASNDVSSSCSEGAGANMAKSSGTQPLTACLTLYPESRAMVSRVLLGRAAAQRVEGDSKAVAPDIYRSLTGPLGLMQSDPEVWGELCNAYCTTGAAAIGISITTSAVVMGNENTAAFHNHRGVHMLLSRCGVREWHPAESDVVCFVSEESTSICNDTTNGVHDNSGGPIGGRSCDNGVWSNGGDARIYRSLVHVGGEGYHLPPGATVGRSTRDCRPTYSAIL